MKTFKIASAAAVFSVGIGTAQAAPVTVNWTDWTRTTQTGVVGTITIGLETIDVTYTGSYLFAQTTPTTNYWIPSAPYVAPCVGVEPCVANAPPNSDIIGISNAATHTFSFSKAIVDPYFAIVSLNGGNQYIFNVADNTLDVVDYGSGYWGAGTLFTVQAGKGVGSTSEGHGIIRLKGSFSSFSFNSTVPEGWNGFTLGVADIYVPPPPGEVSEPATLALLGAGLLSLAVVRRRKSA